MKSFRATWTAFTVMTLMLLFAGPLRADDSGIGTWVRKSDPREPQTAAERGLTMTVEAWGHGGRKPGQSTEIWVRQRP